MKTTLTKWRAAVPWIPAILVLALTLTLLMLVLRALERIVHYVDPQGAAETTALVAVALQAFGALLLIGTIYAAVRNTMINSRQLQMTQEGQITDRFTKAIEQLGDDRLAVQLGGIYALERIARDSCHGSKNSPNWCRDHLTVVEVLTAYIRDNSPIPEDSYDPTKEYKLPSDIQVILTVLGRRDERQRAVETEPLDLRDTNLRGAVLESANLEHAVLARAHLEGAYLGSAHLEHAMLMGVHLENAHLGGTHLEGADLMGAKGLTQEQIDESCMDDQTLLPDDVGPDLQPYRHSQGDYCDETP